LGFLVGEAFAESWVVVSACVSVFVVLFSLDHVDLVFVVAFDIVVGEAAVKGISEEESSKFGVFFSLVAGRLEQLSMNTLT
jgi:hypothetical protein